MQKDLEKLGMTPNEAKVYLALLGLGKTPTGEIIKKTGLHRNIVYESLDKLIRDRLVSESVSKGKKHYKLLDPTVLVEKAQSELNLAGQVAAQVSKRVKIKGPQVTIFEGSDGWATAYRRVVKTFKKNEEVIAFGAGADRWVEAIGDFFIGYEKACQKYNVNYLMIANQSQREELVAHQSNILTQIRYLSEKELPPASTEIFKDRVFLQLYTSPVFLIEIKSQEVADSYRKHFYTLWDMARD